MTPKHSRARKANDFLRVVASCGRKFFAHRGDVSSFIVDTRGRVFFHDAWSRRCIYVAYAGRWRGFSEGGTLKSLIEHLRDYIRTGEPQRLHLGPWPPNYCNGDLWGYGEDMETVRMAAVAHGLSFVHGAAEKVEEVPDA